MPSEDQGNPAAICLTDWMFSVTVDTRRTRGQGTPPGCLGSMGLHCGVRWLPENHPLQEIAGLGILSSPWAPNTLRSEQCISGQA